VTNKSKFKFTAECGEVKMRAFESQDNVNFSVSDNGEGIPVENLDKVFDRYWQAKVTNAASAGLGLSISKGIAEAHGGSLTVKSQLGIGTTFTVQIPNLR
jgi:signal transduction histidine kinase